MAFQALFPGNCSSHVTAIIKMHNISSYYMIKSPFVIILRNNSIYVRACACVCLRVCEFFLKVLSSLRNLIRQNVECSCHMKLVAGFRTSMYFANFGKIQLISPQGCAFEWNMHSVTGLSSWVFKKRLKPQKILE